ncbi:hypothetical protein IWX91DRAFT_178522 [Phyllosticta citricarpa]
MVCKSANFLRTFLLPSFLAMACSFGPWHQSILFNVTMPRPLGTYTYTYTTQRCRLFRVCRDDATSDAASLTERWQSNEHTHILPLGEVCAGNRRRRARVVVSRRRRWVRRKRTSWTCVKWLNGCLGLWMCACSWNDMVSCSPSASLVSLTFPLLLPLRLA